MTLSQTDFGSTVVVSGFSSLPPSEELRLAALGLRRGSRVTKLMRLPLKDPIECLVGSQLLALEGWLLERIVVSSS